MADPTATDAAEPGAPAGAHIPYHTVKSNPAMPDSAMVPSHGETMVSSSGAMGRAPGFSFRVKKASSDGYSARSRSHSSR